MTKEKGMNGRGEKNARKSVRGEIRERSGKKERERE